MPRPLSRRLPLPFALLPLLTGLPAAGLPGEQTAPPLENRLAGHPSPYLAMHAEDPVAWQTWSPEVFERARRENRLVFVSVGYFACHWCHVMQRESFRDPAVAQLLNERFIPVKVDRELRPALDARLIEFVRSTRGQAGWPLNLFVTPDGHPLVGTVYLPRDDFLQLLQRLYRRWHSEGEELAELAREAAEEAAPPATPSAGATLAEGLGESYRQRLADAALSFADTLEGGFGEGNKFPMAPQLEALLALLPEEVDHPLRDFLATTLDHMAERGLHDLLGGGFFRYATDPGWQIPHFEKMLYDNTQLARLYLIAGERLGEPRYTAIGRETLEFMLRELATPEGAFIASLSAVDDQGVEGGYYLFRPETLDRLLPPPQRRIAAAAWGLEGPPTLEAGLLPRRVRRSEEVANGTDIPRQEVERLLAGAAERLRAERARRGLPRDTKVIAAWNGLALAALARGARLPDGTAYRQAAARLERFLRTRLWRGERLLRSAEPEIPGTLEDYAQVALGLLEWSEAGGGDASRLLAERIAGEGWRRFHDARGWKSEEASLLSPEVREAVLADDVLPSPSATLIEVLLRLGGAERRDEALRALNRGHRQLTLEPLWYASHIRLIDAWQSGRLRPRG